MKGGVMDPRARRDLITSIVILLAVFFGVGELHGWQLGILSETPVFVYKATGQSMAERFIEKDWLDLTVKGKVRQGTVTLEVTHELPKSFQYPSQPVIPLRTVHSQKFQKGEQINFDEHIMEGPGEYQIKLLFQKASGTFRVTLPSLP